MNEDAGDKTLIDDATTDAATREAHAPGVKRAAAKASNARTAKAQARAETKPKLFVRPALLKDVRAIQALCRRAYPTMEPYSQAQLRGQIQMFPEGQFVAIYQDELVGYAATFLIDEKTALAPHDWNTITGNGFASRHDDDGDVLYGFEVMVDPKHRGLRIGQRLYNERKRLAIDLKLKAIVFAGRMPGYAKAKRRKQVASAEEYLESVVEQGLRDQVISFQMRNGFEPLRVLHDYLPIDTESRGNAVHLVWWNPAVAPDPASRNDKQRRRPQSTVRVACIQYQQRKVESFQEFADQVEYFVDAVADYKSDFCVFPELFTLQLLSIDNENLPPDKAIAQLSRYTERLKEMLSRLAVHYNINIIGGSHPTRDEDGDIINVCYVCLRDGSIHARPKIHPTPNERYWWSIVGADEASTVMTDCGPIGIMICYDSEFPELARHLVDQGAQILFVPFCTDERKSYLRVRYCCQARAVENQVYVALAGNVGNLPNVENMDIQYAQSCILTPCDFPFDRDGIAADTTPNSEMVAIADLNLDTLRQARANGTVQNLRDRRFDLYSVQWRKERSR
ncbi:bifunctional GNAT family N-acetyltransferase/carbon-nitrogen hydrolase family protein [Salinarimonas ramus]|uniref:Hydrolase YhcX n=1 Tax=Salinarimonas ramus TaxID=690164 RepID=A0A917QFU8_9HYPH|nr:bifunctional GNAT family N-acetyltransferase/carbon-nitrogen hydrolase family protein [Salinarimonas ramus]GGK48513.1 hydrolase YhcX [Salinarimonas ramus]